MGESDPCRLSDKDYTWGSHDSKEGRAHDIFPVNTDESGLISSFFFVGLFVLVSRYKRGVWRCLFNFFTGIWGGFTNCARRGKKRLIGNTHGKQQNSGIGVAIGVFMYSYVVLEQWA